MSIANAYHAEFEQECTATRKCLERLPADKFGWQPHPKSMTLGQLATHVATVPQFVLGMAQQDGYNAEDMPGGFPSAESAEQLLEMHESSVAYVREHLPAIGDDAMPHQWSFRRGGEPMVTLPRAALLRSIMLNHWVHHRGQLSVYMRLLDIPVPSIYGPSADDNPFAPSAE